jgi:hypothetical protein
MTLIVLFSTLSRVIDEQLASNRFANQLRRRRSNRNRSRKHQDENCASPAHAFSTHLTSLARPRRAAMRSTPCSLSRPPTNSPIPGQVSIYPLRCGASVRGEFLQAYSCKHSSARFLSLKRQAWWQSFDMRGIGSGPP